jgi:O-antigen/teichoic acid export membrane protein
MKRNFLYSAAVFYSMAFPFVIGILVKRIVLVEIVGAFAFTASIGLILSMVISTLRNSVERLVPKYLGLKENEKANKVASLSLSFLLVLVIFGVILLTLTGLFFHGDIWQVWAFAAFGVFWAMDNIISFFLST